MSPGRPRSSPSRPRGAPVEPGGRPGLALHCDALTISPRLVDGDLVMGLAGVLDRRSRSSLLRVAQRIVRTGSGRIVVDCAALTSWDDCGVDVLGLLPHLPGVASVALDHVDPALGRQLDAAGLAGRLGLHPPHADAP